MKNEISKILNLIGVGNTTNAVELAKELYIKNPNNISATKVFAYALIQIGRFEKVIEVLENGYKTADNTKDYDFYNNLGYAHLQLESFQKAITSLEQAVKIRPNSVQAYISLADVYQKLKRFHKAEFFINKALEISRNDPNGFEIENNINLLLLKSEVNSALEKNDETVTLFTELLDKSFNADLFFIKSD